MKTFTKHDEIKSLLKEQQDTWVVLDVYADWCGPCKRIAPEFEKLSLEYKDKPVFFGKINYDELDTFCKKCGVASLPTFLFMYNGIIKKYIVGTNISSVKQFLDSCLSTQNYITTSSTTSTSSTISTSR